MYELHRAISICALIMSTLPLNNYGYFACFTRVESLVLFALGYLQQWSNYYWK